MGSYPSKWDVKTGFSTFSTGCGKTNVENESLDSSGFAKVFHGFSMSFPWFWMENEDNGYSTTKPVESAQTTSKICKIASAGKKSLKYQCLVL